ncbi:MULTISPECIES: porin [Marinobacter]|uniref:porin n=1 Tax=Marinobacter TaxID=2742 RepID=UPI001D1755EE|nr:MULTISPECIES: porin [Marinobacter]
MAVGSFITFPAVALADNGPIVYGKVNVSYENIDDGTADDWELRSNASRLGVKGDLDLDVNDLKAVYKAEFEISVDDGDKDGETFSQRNIYGGFAHARLGTLIAGKFDSPLKAAQGDVDQFGDLEGDLKNIMGGDERLSNIVQYSTPEFADAITVNVAVIPGEEAGTEDEDGPADSVSSSIVFDNDMLYAALAYDSEVETTLYDYGDDVKADTLRAAAGLKMDAFELGALFQQSESSDDIGGVSYEDTAYLVSGAYKINRLKLKAQYGMNDLDQTDDELTLMALGADYKVGDGSKVFAYYSKVEADDSDLEDTAFGVGFQHKFSM